MFILTTASLFLSITKQATCTLTMHTEYKHVMSASTQSCFQVVSTGGALLSIRTNAKVATYNAFQFKQREVIQSGLWVHNLILSAKNKEILLSQEFNSKHYHLLPLSTNVYSTLRTTTDTVITPHLK